MFRGSRQLALRAEDLTVEKIAMVFQVRADSIYLTDDNNRGILPGHDGTFDTNELQISGHYEIHGVDTTDEGSPWHNPVLFAFRRPASGGPSSSSASLPQPVPRATGPKMMQRNILIAEVVDGKPETRKTMTVRFTEFESSVGSIRAKVADALGQDEPIVLIDNHGNELIDSEGTRGSAFWKQHARKIYAVPEEQLQRLRGSRSRRRESRHEDTELPEVIDQIEEVVLASQGLNEVSRTLKELVQFVQANPHTAVCLSDSQAAAVKAAFACIICGDPMKEPIFSSCCKSLLGCCACMERWKESHTYCPKCRAVEFYLNTESVVGLDDALAALHTLFL